MESLSIEGFEVGEVREMDRASFLNLLKIV
jgi:hypothetical protein